MRIEGLETLDKKSFLTVEVLDAGEVFTFQGSIAPKMIVEGGYFVDLETGELQEYDDEEYSYGPQYRYMPVERLSAARLVLF